jgi:hypothetical protein
VRVPVRGAGGEWLPVRLTHQRSRPGRGGAIFLAGRALSRGLPVPSQKTSKSRRAIFAAFSKMPPRKAGLYEIENAPHLKPLVRVLGGGVRMAARCCRTHQRARLGRGSAVYGLPFPSAQQLRQLGEIHRHPPRVAGSACWSPSGATQRDVGNRGEAEVRDLRLKRR